MGVNDRDPSGLEVMHWNHGLLKSTRGAGSTCANWARASGIDLNSSKWGWELPRSAHTLKAGGGIHTNWYENGHGKIVPKGKLPDGSSRNWQNEWDHWARMWKKSNPSRLPTENDFNKQY